MTRRPVSLRARALALLARREYSRRELERKLSQQRRADARKQEGFSGNPTDAALDDDAFDAGGEEALADPEAPEAGQEIRAILDEFEERGWLSEARFVEASVNRLSRRYGPRRIEQTLRERGASDASIEATRPYLQQQAESTARAALKRRFPDVPADAGQRVRQIRFLQARGFDYDVIRKVLSQPSDPAED